MRRSLLPPAFCLFLLLMGFLPLRAQFMYRTSVSIADVTLYGTAQIRGDGIRVVAAERSRTGSVWFNTKQRVVDGFETTFSFMISEPGSRSPWVPGGDGFAFVIQNSSVYEGGVGGGIGYEGIRNSFAVEFDTYDNNPDHNPEPNGNHISVHSRGRRPNSADHRTSLGWTTSIPDLKAGARHTARIRYVPGIVEVYLDDLSRPLLTVRVRLETLLQLDKGRCWMGFTAATGGAWANVDLFSMNNEVVVTVQDIFFEQGKATLTTASFPELRKLADVLEGEPGLMMEMRGHTDDHGDEDYNQKLSQRRADAVRAYLIRHGVAGERVLARGYGAGTPIGDNASAAGRARNRRVEARLYKE